MSTRCTHLSKLQPVTPKSWGCEECLVTGSEWVHLRMCLSCGHVGCCDDSPNRHATRHFQATSHPVIMSYEPDEDWLWCYEDRTFSEHAPPRLKSRRILPPDDTFRPLSPL